MNIISQKSSPVLSVLNNPNITRRHVRRMLTDKLVQYCMTIGGIGILFAISLIFFYLLYVVFPLFESADAGSVDQYNVPELTSGKTLLLAMEEQNEIAVRFTDQGKAIFFAVDTGKTISIESLTIPEDSQIVSFAQGEPSKGIVAYGLSDGRFIIARHNYKVTYPNDKRLITPKIEYPLGDEPLVIDNQGTAVKKVALRVEEEMIGKG